jgi:hypothetical protein
MAPDDEISLWKFHRKHYRKRGASPALFCTNLVRHLGAAARFAIAVFIDFSIESTVWDFAPNWNDYCLSRQNNFRCILLGSGSDGWS